MVCGLDNHLRKDPVPEVLSDGFVKSVCSGPSTKNKGETLQISLARVSFKLEQITLCSQPQHPF